MAFPALGIKLKGDELSYVLGVLKSFGDLIGEFTGLRIKPYSRLRFIIVKGCKAKSVKWKSTWTMSGGKQIQASKSHLPLESDQKCLIPPAASCDSTYEMSYTSEVLPEPWSPGFLLEVIHIGMLCLACTKIPDLQKQIKCKA